MNIQNNTKETLLVVLLSMLMFSCECYQFSDPQPVDVENMYEFPRQFRGTWINNGATIVIGKNSYRKSWAKPSQIINGIWTNPADTATHTTGHARNKDFESLSSIQYDEQKHPVDTIVHYVIKGNKIYEIEEELLQGVPYSITNDTIYCEKVYNMEFELGRNAFLRRISKNQYILNIASNAPLSWEKPWWQIIILESTAEGKIVARYPDSKIKDNADRIGTTNYFESQWTKQDILRLDKEGIFTDTVLNLEIRKKIK